MKTKQVPEQAFPGKAGSASSGAGFPRKRRTGGACSFLRAPKSEKLCVVFCAK